MSETDVTAVVLTHGEPYVDRALASIRSQTVAPADVLVVSYSDASTFHDAINLAARRVRTEFFVQVDADMILDAYCFEVLRSQAEDHIGIVAGLLRDPLQGRIVGIKLFRTACFRRRQYRDGLICDAVFERGIRADGWSRVNVLDFGRTAVSEWHTVGQHRPDYEPFYTFSKFRVLGARRRIECNLYAALTLLQHLRTTEHPSALPAQIGFAHGTLAVDRSLRVRKYEPDVETEFLRRFLEQPATSCLPHKQPLPGDLRELFGELFRVGIQTRTSHDRSIFQQGLARVQCEGAERALVGTVAICHGLFCEAFRENDARGKFEVLDELLAALLPGTYRAADLLLPASEPGVGGKRP